MSPRRGPETGGEDPDGLEDDGTGEAPAPPEAEAPTEEECDALRQETRELVRNATSTSDQLHVLLLNMAEDPRPAEAGAVPQGEEIQRRLQDQLDDQVVINLVASQGALQAPQRDRLASFIADLNQAVVSANEYIATHNEQPADPAPGAPAPGEPEPAPGVPPHPPQPPRAPGQPAINITDPQRREATKLTDNIIQAMRDEERNRLIQRGLDTAGFFRSVFFPGRVTRDVDAAKQYEVTPAIRAMVEEYALQRTTGAQVTASGNEVFRLMQSYGFEINPQNGQFEPLHADSNWLSRLVHFDRTKTTGATFVGGMALGHATRIGLAGVLEGAGRAVGAGALVGGLSGWLRGRREGAEATTSGDSWTAELDAALATGQESQIELVCHKVERIINDPQARQEFFRGRTRMEGAKVLQRYQEGIRRLGLIEMSRDVTRAREAGQEFGSEQERNAFIAENYTRFNREMSQGEGRFMATYGAEYSNALLREVGIIAVNAGGTPVPGAADGALVPNAPGMNPEDVGARQQVETGFTRDSARRRTERRRIVATNVIKGAVIGAVAGGVGWYIGQWISGMIHPNAAGAAGGAGHGGAGAGGPGGHGGVGPVAPGHEGAGAAGGSGATPVGPGSGEGGIVGGGHVPTGTENHWGYFTNNNTMPEQAFTPERVHGLGMDSLLNDSRCPTTFIDGHALVGTDQGAALRAAVLSWQNNLNFHGMDHSHIANLMSFAGSHDSALPVDVGAGYHLSLEQGQAVIDHIWNNGSPIDANIFDANQIMAEQAMGHAANAAGNVAPGIIGGAGAISPEVAQAAGAAGVAGATLSPEAAQAAGIATAEAAKGIWPGWLLLAGAGGWAGGYAIDSARRRGEIGATNQSIAGIGARNIGNDAGGPFGGIGAYGAPPEPEPVPPQPVPPVPPVPVPPVPEPNPNREADLERLNRERGELQERIDQIQADINERNTRLALPELGIDADNAVYNELENVAEGEARQQEFANRISNVRRERGLTLAAVEEANQGGEQEAVDERLRQYAQWDWYRAEERIGPFNERIELQANLAVANTRLAEIDAEVERLNQAA